jgi:predicted aminopeptidase
METNLWIDVKDELPDLNGDGADQESDYVLVFDAASNRMWVANYRQDRWFDEAPYSEWVAQGCDGYRLGTVTHWQQLPSPPTAKEIE